MSFLKSLLTFRNSKSMRVQDDIELKSPTGIKQDGIIKHTQKVSKKDRDEFTPGCLKGEVLSRVFAEDYQLIETSILDPRGPVVRHWNELFLAAGMISLFVDPLFLFLPKMTPDLCIEASVSKLQVILTVLRILSDFFYAINILVQFRTAYVAPSSRVIGRGELVIDPWKIAYRYLHRGFGLIFWLLFPFHSDFCVNPLESLENTRFENIFLSHDFVNSHMGFFDTGFLEYQHAFIAIFQTTSFWTSDILVMNWAIIPYVAGSVSSNSKIALRCIPLAQFLLRLFLLYPLSWKILKDTGKMTETAWVGAAHNMLLFYIASNVSGACWYLLTIERQEACWRSVCDLENPPCVYEFFDCNTINDTTRSAWFAATNVSTLCNPSNTYYEYGVYALGLSNNAPSEVFVKKYFFCFYWALQSLTSIGNNLATTGYVGENIFVNLVAVLGLVLLAALVGNMQRYLQSTSLRLEESRQKRTETEQWMHYRQIPPELRQSVRKYDQYRWVATRGVEEKTIISALPKDLQRKINNHLCNNLVRKVPLFDQMDDKMLDGICERLKAALYTEGTFLVREGDPVREMLFIIRGHLDSYTTNGGQRGFFNSSRIGPGNFCGEELLTWALDGPRSVLPSSTRTVKAISETEAFALTSEDLKFVALQFRMLHSRQLIQKFRFYSHQWRTWAACYVQAVWRRHQKRKELAHHNATDGGRWFDEMDIFVPQPGSGLEVYAARLITNIRMGGSKRFESEESGERPNEFNYDENEE